MVGVSDGADFLLRPHQDWIDQTLLGSFDRGRQRRSVARVHNGRHRRPQTGATLDELVMPRTNVGHVLRQR
jgi:hypothetical protein